MDIETDHVSAAVVVKFRRNNHYDILPDERDTACNSQEKKAVF